MSQVIRTRLDALNFAREGKGLPLLTELPELVEQARGEPERIYVASPYSNPDPAVVEANVARSVAAAAECIRRGHQAISPLAASHPIALLDPSIEYERYMAIDLAWIKHWATALLYLAPSPGAMTELAYAEDLGRKIYMSIDEVPRVR